MATLEWDQVGEKIFETGVSKAVFYGSDTYGIPWNGITAIAEKDADSVEPVYFDGTKFNDLVTLGDYSATLSAFTYPEEFLSYEGIVEDQTGFYAHNQPKKPFGLSYQTKIGSDVDPSAKDYKIHLVWNLTALPGDRQYQTLALDSTPLDFQWDLSAIPEEMENFRPTAHAVIDSRKMDPALLADVEAVLYGDEDHPARLPPLKDFATWLRAWQRLIVRDNGDGTWTATSIIPGQIIMLDSITFQITTDTATYLDADTYTIESTEKNDDIWLP